MVGHLKGASVIQQCVRCYSLRSPADAHCPTCAAMLNEVVTEVRWLALNDISTDIVDLETYGIVSSDELQGRGTIH